MNDGKPDEKFLNKEQPRMDTVIGGVDQKGGEKEVSSEVDDSLEDMEELNSISPEKEDGNKTDD